MNMLEVFRDLWSHLEKRRKMELGIVSILMLISSLSEVFSLTAVIPYLSIISNPNTIQEIPFFEKIININAFQESENILILISVFFVSTVILSAALRIINLKLTTNLAAKIGNDLSVKVYKNILLRPYSYHVENNSGNTITAITNHIQITVVSINFILQMLTSIFITISLTICLLFINFAVTSFTLLTISLTYFCLIIKTKNKLLFNSQLFTNASKKQVISVQEGMGTIRDIILNNNENIYLEEYSFHDQIMRKSQAENQFIKLFPRHAIEAIGITLIAICGTIISRDQTGQAVAITSIGTIAIGSQKLLPSSQQIFSNFSGIRGNLASIKNITSLLDNRKFESNYKVSKIIKKPKLNKFNQFNSLKISKVFFKYNTKQTWLINNLNIEIKRGEKIGIIGKTGSGKSTIIDLMMGLLEPIKGELFVNNINLFSLENYEYLKKWQSIIGHVPQMIFLADSSFLENIALGIKKNEIDYRKVIKCAKEAKIDSFIENCPEGYETSVGENGIKLSGGQRQRIAIARALYKNSQVLVFDEATSALDEKTEKQIISSINSLPQDLTIITIAHRLSTLKGYDKIINLN